MDALGNFISVVQDDMGATASRFAALYHPNRKVCPVPFFGDVRKATVITVGVNPSADEFLPNRRWQEDPDALYLERRLLAYFTTAPAPPHPWFATWTDALSIISCSYTATAAHLDLSPRPTIPMSEAPRGLFKEMVEHDVRWFFELLKHCPKARLLMLAGCATHGLYMHEFLSRNAPRFGCVLGGSVERGGKGRVSLNTLEVSGRRLPVFFCSVSPSARFSRTLVERVRTEKELLSHLVRHPLS
jgi:hypothetical protein